VKLYLAHPFDTRKWVREWELQFEKKHEIELFNPFYDAPGRTDVEKIDGGCQERYEKIDPTELVTRDLKYIHSCDGLVAVVADCFMVGTFMEIVYANIYKLPVYLIVTNGHHKHPWLVYHSTKVFTSLENFESYMNLYFGNITIR